MRRPSCWLLMFTSMVLLHTSGCTLKGTINETTDTTSNITGTTSGRTWFNEDGLLHPEHKAIAFAAFNHDNLEQDMARGHGEYLASLGTLLGMTDETQPVFQAKAQGDFLTLMSSDHATRVQQLRGLSR